MKACSRKFEQSHTKCEYCGQPVSNDKYGEHRVQCKTLHPPKQSATTAAVGPAIAAPMANKRPAAASAALRPIPVGADLGQKKIKRTMVNGRVVEIEEKEEPPPAPLETPAPPPVSSAAGRICEECQMAAGKIRCQECEQLLCTVCDQKLHEKGARTRHTRTPFQTSSASVSASSPASAASLTDSSAAVKPDSQGAQSAVVASSSVAASSVSMASTSSAAASESLPAGSANVAVATEQPDDAEPAGPDNRYYCALL